MTDAARANAATLADRCGHDDYDMVSCLPGSVPHKMNVRARCRVCGHEVEMKDAEITGVDYPPPTEGITVTEVELTRMTDEGADQGFLDWMRDALERN